MSLTEIKQREANNQGIGLLAVPDHVRSFIATQYGVPLQCAMFIHPNELQKVYVQHDDVLQYVDFKSSNEGPQVCASVLNSPAVVASAPCSIIEKLLPGMAAVSVETGGRDTVHTLYSPLSDQGISLTNANIPRAPVLLNTQLHSVLPSYGHGRNPAVLFESQSCRRPASRFPHVDQHGWHNLTDAEREIIQKERRKANAYKTALCQTFRETGACTYGEGCRFAHGESELRPPPQAHPKYKTQLCNKFALLGQCPYGARCQFIHQRPNEQTLRPAQVLAYGTGYGTASEVLRHSSTSPHTVPPRCNIHSRTAMFHSSEERSRTTQNESAMSTPAEGKVNFTSSLSHSQLTAAMTRWKKASANMKHQCIALGNGEQANSKSGEVDDRTVRCETSEAGCSTSSSYDYWTTPEDSSDYFSRSCFPRILPEPWTPGLLSGGMKKA